MAFLDKLLGRERSEKNEQALAVTPDAELSTDTTEIDKAIADRSRLNTCKQFPLSEIALLGGAFAQLIPGLNTITQSVTMNTPVYIPCNNLANETLKTYSKKEADILAPFYKDSKKMVKWKKLDSQQLTSSVKMGVDPMTIAIAVMMMEINHKLDAIQQTQQTILSFLQEDKQAALQGDYNILSDILDKYKYNWDNEQFRNNYHMKALDIKQSAEQNIVFYQKQISNNIKSFPKNLFLDQAAIDAKNKIAEDLSNYGMALYLYSFSSYVEVMLLGNFSATYLESVVQKIKDYQIFYVQEFSKCSALVKEIVSGSVQMKVQSAVAHSAQIMGNMIASSPLLSKGTVDEWLKESSERMAHNKEQKVDELVNEFNSKLDTGAEMFIDSIMDVERISNQSAGFMVDKGTLYVMHAQSV